MCRHILNKIGCIFFKLFCHFRFLKTYIKEFGQPKGKHTLKFMKVQFTQATSFLVLVL